MTKNKMYCTITYNMEKTIDLSDLEINGFDWDIGNKEKNLVKHKVSNQEGEEVFFNEPVLIFQDAKHSQKEERLVAYGRTDKKRLLIVVFSIRKGLIRIISSRDQHKKERRVYEKNKNLTQI